MKNKFLIPMFIVLCIAALLCACDKSGGESADSATDAANVSTESGNRVSTAESTAARSEKDESLVYQIYGDTKSLPHLSVIADKTSVSAGDEITLTYTLYDADNMASLEFDTDFDSGVFSVQKKSEKSFDEYYSYTNEAPGSVLYAGFTSQTIDLNDAVVFTVVLKADDKAAAGDYDINCKVTQFMVGTDETGNEIANVAAVKDLSSVLKITVE